MVLVDKWGKVELPPEASVEKLRIPIHVIAREALDVARFAERYWEPQAVPFEGATLPGLRSAVCAGGLIGEGIAGELLELRRALAAAQEHYRLAIESPDASPVDRARELIADLRDVLAFYAKSAGDETIPLQLARLAAARRKTGAQLVVSNSLRYHAELAERNLSHIDGLGGFDASVIHEARVVAEAIYEHRSRRNAAFDSDARRAIRLRNHIAILLLDRMQSVRTAARFVFRKHPEVVRQVTSAYARQQRTAHRRRQKDRGERAEPGQ